MSSTVSSAPDLRRSRQKKHPAARRSAPSLSAQSASVDTELT